MATRDSITRLYGGNYEVTYRNGNHRYYIGKQTIPSVTTVMSIVLAKPDLMLWPMNLALKYLEERLPHVTSDDLKMARTAHVRRREDGANTGTAVHYLAEQRLKTPLSRPLNLETATLPEDVVVAATAFDTWCRQHKPKVVGIEKVVYSPTLGYVGTYDSILRLDGKTYLCDVKTTNAALHAPKGIYPEHFIQMGAYYTAYEEQRQFELANGYTELKPIDDMMVISVKKTGVIDTMAAGSIGLTLEQASETWRSVMTVYTQLKELKKQLGGSA